MAFVRLHEAVLLESVLEVPIPVRFLFLLMGPPTANIDYHQIGRSISTLMSDQVTPAILQLYTANGKGFFYTAPNHVFIGSHSIFTRRLTRQTTGKIC